MAEQVKAVLHGAPDPDEAWMKHPGMPGKEPNRTVVIMAMRGCPRRDIMEKTGKNSVQVSGILSTARYAGMKVPVYDRTGMPKIAKDETQQATPQVRRLTVDHDRVAETLVRTRDAKVPPPGPVVRYVGEPRPKGQWDYTVQAPSYLIAAMAVLRREPRDQQHAAALFYAARELALMAEGDHVSA